MITVCFVYFRSLTLANLAAALYSLRRQDLSNVSEIVLLDNNTEDSHDSIQFVVEALNFPVPVRVISEKHGDATRTHAWSTNYAVREVKTDLVFFTRADFILDYRLLEKLCAALGQSEFITSQGYHVSADIGACNARHWQAAGPANLRDFAGQVIDYAKIDTGVWLASKDVFDRVGGLDERLTAWGHAQTHFQHKLYEAGVTFICLDEVLYYHPRHAAERDITVAHEQLRAVGANLQEMWARHEGVSPY